MNAGELCAKQPIVVQALDDLVVAARSMRDKHVGCVVVVEPHVATGGQQIVGILTDRDIVTTVVARDIDTRSLRVGDVMTRQPLTVTETTSLRNVLQRMRELGVRRIPVVKAGGDLLGVLTLDDIVSHLADEFGAVAASIDHGQRVERALRP